MRPRRPRRFRFNSTAVDSSVNNSSRDVNFTAMTAYPLRRFIVENENLAMAEGEEDPRAENYRPKPLPADQKPIDVLNKLANEDRKKWEMVLNRARLMAGYPAFRKVGFEDIGRMEVDLGDYADGVKWVKDGKEKDCEKYTFRYCKYEAQSITPGKRLMNSSEHEKSHRQSSTAKSKVKKGCQKQFQFETESKYREYEMKAEVVLAICNDWQDAKEGAGWKWIGPCGFNWRYSGMNAAIQCEFESRTGMRRDWWYAEVNASQAEWRRSMTEITVMMHRLINLRVMERNLTNNIGGATDENRHPPDVEYEWTRKDSVPSFDRSCKRSEMSEYSRHASGHQRKECVGIGKGQSREEEEGRKDNVALRRLAHARHDAVDQILPALLECGQGILAILLVRSELEQTREEVLERHLAVLLRPCSRTVSMMIRMGISVEMEERTVLDGAPLALRDLTEYRVNLSQQLVDDPVLGALLKVLEGVLEEDEASQSKDKEDGREIAYLRDKRSSLMTCKRGLLAVEGLVAAAKKG
ncbi:hypothetical protein B0H13DRAFT_1904279 [Mycena leptocephala]|nr:hypothetical protein B0H13DRAFT_1904279 [Mycena leptocephala]